ncbi:MAG: ornithine cyclodeaminase family protein [Spirochaetia bacterium]|jgi:L-arginine dehydrogenase|nr:ornithine cyclodeaminase family protein [Spirochaetia bacterium]
MDTSSFINLDAAQVEARLGSLDVLAAMRSMFTDLGRGKASQPPQAVALFPDDAGDFITYSGVLAGEKVFGLKVSPYLVKAGSAPVITAYTLLMSMESGKPLMLCDSKALTKERTAATTALAVDLLAPAGGGTLTVVGSGPIALAHLKYALPLRNWAAVRITSPNIAAKAETLKPVLASMAAGTGLAAGARMTGNPGGIEIVPDQKQAVKGATVVLLCTSSGTPVLDLDLLSGPALVTSISTNAPMAHEIDPGALGSMDVYCDYRATTPDAAGEMLIARKGGWAPSSIKGDLGELLNDKAARPDFGRHVFFRSVGLGLEDVQLALMLYKAG